MLQFYHINMEETIYLFDKEGLFEGPLDWFNNLPEHFITTTYEGVLNGNYAIASDKQIDFGLAHPDYDLFHQFNMIEYTKEEYQKKIAEINESIRITRLNLYKSQSDPLYINYQKEIALGNVDKAEEIKTLWLSKVKEIEENNPYITE